MDKPLKDGGHMTFDLASRKSGYSFPAYKLILLSPAISGRQFGSSTKTNCTLFLD